MLDKNGTRQLAFLVKLDKVEKHPNADRLDIATVGGWKIVCGRDELNAGDVVVYFEIDSKLPETKPFTDMEFLASKHFKIKTQKIRGEYSQGMIVPISAFIGTEFEKIVLEAEAGWTRGNEDARFLTEDLRVTYSVMEDNKRKSKINPNAKYNSMMSRYPKFAKTKFARWCMKRDWAKKLLYFFLGNKKKDNAKEWPVGRFPGVSKTDQERCENMTWVLQDKTPFIVTQKCDGSSGTYILERKGKNKFEFYVCSRNVRMASKEQECFYGSHNYYWEVAEKYEIERKMKRWLEEDPNLEWVCWQGEICAPDIQKNPHKLSETHFYCFHWTDNVNGRMDIRDAAKNWKDLNMEVVPIVNENYILPDDFEEFKLSADGLYDPSVCEGHTNCSREGYVYYKNGEPTFSFKNVSREYLAKLK